MSAPSAISSPRRRSAPRAAKASSRCPSRCGRWRSNAQIDELDRRVLFGAVLFSLLGGALGYWMAERIADPVNRLTRATRRIARGDLDARIAATSADELGRLVRDFNQMAADLQRQRSELERTQRLEAWADMARQVAHDIKNPLTPIQLSAEHARRVNIDRGRPLSPVLDECVTAILGQVRLLRQIASEFSSFASSPTPHPGADGAACAARGSRHAVPRRAGGPDRDRRGRARRPPAGDDRPDAVRARADQHHRERAVRDARNRAADDHGPAEAGHYVRRPPKPAASARLAASSVRLQPDRRGRGRADTGVGMDEEAVAGCFSRTSRRRRPAPGSG